MKPTDQQLKEYYERQLGYVTRRIETGKPSQKEIDPKTFDKRQRIWRHNSFIGWTVMMRQHLNSIVEADSTTTETKQYARTMLGLVPKLQNSLSVRVDKENEK